MKKLFLLVASALSLHVACAQGQTNQTSPIGQTNLTSQTNQTGQAGQTNQVVQEVYQDPKAPLEKRVEDLFGRLTEEEKLKLLGGTGFTTQPIERLGVPAMGMVDAGQGVRGGSSGTQGPATAFPAGVSMASTWDTN
jgi:beta-glucosidase-like glycosyl hydrolase